MIPACENPFRTERVLQVRYRLPEGVWAELLARCSSLRNRAAVTGPHGSGKTTFLEDLESRLRAAGWGTRFIRLDEEHRAFDPAFLSGLFAGVTASDIILFDGAEQLPACAWWRFRWRARHAGGLIITTHRSGRLPVLWECRTSPELLTGIAADLLALPEDAVKDRGHELFRKHRGNLRAALWEWYDLAAGA